MIVSKTPLRIPFFSGGTDIPAFYEKEIGQALSCTIDKYIYVTLQVHGDGLNTFNGESVFYNKIVEETLKFFGVKGVSITTTADIRMYGTGLGGSSAFTVGLCNVLYRWLYNQTPTPRNLAEMACAIEIDRCKFPIGKQDQYAAAFGGLNMFYFHKNDKVSISNYSIPKDFNWNKQLKLINSTIKRDSSNTIVKDIDEVKRLSMRKGMQYADDALTFILNGRYEDLGELLKKSWEEKKKANESASTSIIDALIEEMSDCNVTLGGSLGTYPYSKHFGAKVLGAGGGGFILTCVPPPGFIAFQGKLNKLGLKETYYHFIDEGSKIILDERFGIGK